MEDPPEGRIADEAISPQPEPAAEADATATAEAGAATGQMSELPTDDSQEPSSESVAGDRARRELQVIIDILPSLKEEIADPSKLSDEIALTKLAEFFARLESAPGVPQTIGVGGLPSGFAAGGPPRILADLAPREKRLVLPAAPDELKRDFRLLAHGANYAETRETSLPDGTVDGFLDTLVAYASSLDMELDTMEKILITAKRYLRGRIVDMHATRRSEQAASLQFFADAFDQLLARFFKAEGAPAPNAPSGLTSITVVPPVEEPSSEPVPETQRSRAAISSPQVSRPGSPPGKQERPRDPILEVKDTIRQLRAAGHSQQEICNRLSDTPRPKNAAWKDLTWPAAFKDKTFRGAVKSWISRVE